MKITGKVILEKTPGRRDPWVTMKVESDYFIALQIIEIDGQQVTTTQDMYNFIKNILPKVVIDNEVVNDLFTNPTLPPNAKDVPHITLGNFPDFRFKRSIEQDIDCEKIDSAIAICKRILLTRSLDFVLSAQVLFFTSFIAWMKSTAFLFKLRERPAMVLIE